MYDFSKFKSKVEEIKNWLKEEFKDIRTGRATPALLDRVQVENYGTMMPIAHVAAISVEDARSLRVTPYDPENIKEIEKAITNAQLGVGVNVDSTGLRITFPELTQERREMLAKLAKQKQEQAYVSLKQARDEVWSDIQEQFKQGNLTEDEKFKEKENMEEITKKAHQELEQMLKHKLEEINS